jgi:hypothetical protein
MATEDESPEFTERHVSLISDSLGNAVDIGRRELLPRILAEWVRTDLREHLRVRNEITPERRKRVKTVGKCAQKLLEALGAIDVQDRYGIAFKMRTERGSTEIDGMVKRIEDEGRFLTPLAEAALQTWKRGPGQPRNIRAYLVMKDIAAIFEWLTNIEATRQVDRISGVEAGPFWQFAAAIWPVVFGEADDGLPAAMKNWSSYRKRYGERSALIANIAMRHPTWGIFER